MYSLIRDISKVSNTAFRKSCNINTEQHIFVYFYTKILEMMIFVCFFLTQFCWLRFFYLFMCVCVYGKHLGKPVEFESDSQTEGFVPISGQRTYCKNEL